MIRFPILAVLLACCASVPPATPTRDAGAYLYRNTVDIGAIGESQLNPPFLEFRRLALAGEKEITLRIDSLGGVVFVGYAFGRAIEDLKKAHGIRVTCIVDGAGYSMAAILLQGPVCDRRLATLRSTLLLHSVRLATAAPEAEPLLGALNTAADLVVSARLKITPAEYRSRIAAGDWVMGVPEALHYNVIDGIANPADIAPPASVL